ncbi:uncharacterized protein J4E84_002091 [Alternaria hordeiaustralica]|uniref:uncharacterized protein n=1 Tax=Alternaria hordeiaustralica TaxID=1187925 RepID=UPI0020C4FE20|nr:uncharacterized protein J4E84_002091 [Alternaria hordeiaustralica]KAI4695464.1 hypothetical protein J4E84_002091 [Alternaria hordeiaustralica]
MSSRKSHGKDVSGRGQSPVRGAAKYQSSALHDTSKEQDAYYVSKDGIRINYKKPSFVGSSRRPRKHSQTEGTHQADSPFASAGDHKPSDRSHTPTKPTKDSGGPKVSETVLEQSSDEEFTRAPSPGPQQSRPPSISSESPDEGMAPGQKPPEDLYEFLGVTRSDDTAAVKEAYLKMIRKCHPDKCNSLPDGDKVKEENQRKAAYLNATKDVLLDADKRAFYDETGLMS